MEKHSLKLVRMRGSNVLVRFDKPQPFTRQKGLIVKATSETAYRVGKIMAVGDAPETVDLKPGMLCVVFVQALNYLYDANLVDLVDKDDEGEYEYFQIHAAQVDTIVDKVDVNDDVARQL